MSSFLIHQFSEAERAWLTFAIENQPFDPRVAIARLHKLIPRDFRPNSIDTFFLRQNRPTLITRRLLAPSDPIYKIVDLVVEAARSILTADPHTDSIEAWDLAKQLDLPETDVRAAIECLPQFGGFPVGGGREGEGCSQLLTSIEYGNEAIFRWKSLDDALQETYDTWKATPKIGIWPLENQQVANTPPTKRNTAFVLMSFDGSRGDLEDSYETIKRVCLKFDITAFRADDIQQQGKITEQVLSEISSCEHLIADLTMERPNVYYEIGYAHALGKHPILYRKEGTKMHFDLYVHKAPEYRNATDLDKKLTKRLTEILGRDPKSP